jgi:hypothetical protein
VAGGVLGEVGVVGVVGVVDVALGPIVVVIGIALCHSSWAFFGEEQQGAVRRVWESSVLDWFLWNDFWNNDSE